MDVVKIGILGVGNIGSSHLKCLHQGLVENARVTAVCDSSPYRRELVKQAYSDVAVYEDAETFIEKADMDAVIIAVPHPLHSELAQKAFAQGLHVLVEKPVDITVPKAEALNRAAQESGKVFAIMFNQRTNPLFQKAKELMEQGAIGNLKRTSWFVTNWYRTQHYYDSGTWRATWNGEGGGVLMNQAPHQLDLWQWICGMPEAVLGICQVGKYHNITVEDDAQILVRYPGGATGLFVTTTGEAPGTNRLEIVGTKGRMILENGSIKLDRLAEDEREVCFTSEVDFCKIDSTRETITIEDKGSGHRGIIQNFVNAILTGEPLIAPGQEGIRSLTIANAAYLSAWQGSAWVELPFDTEAYEKHLREKCAIQKQERSEKITGLTQQYSDRWQVQW